MEREAFLSQIELYFRSHPIVAILGPRQCGKTTLAKMYCNHGFGRSHYFDLEGQTDWGRLQDPKLAPESSRGLW